MDLKGLSLCSRYSYPPNSLSLCGPDKQNDLFSYASSGKSDKGTLEILSQFSTLYPYLNLIAYENNIPDPFDPRVVEAYWLGNKLLNNVPLRQFASHLTDRLLLKKKIKKNKLDKIFDTLDAGALPSHAFHVTNIYKRTGHFDIPHTIETMDACLINWGRVIKIEMGCLEIETQALNVIDNKLTFKQKKRTIMYQGKKDIYTVKINQHDWVSYHWGYLCHKLTKPHLNNLIYYTNQAINLVNI